MTIVAFVVALSADAWASSIGVAIGSGVDLPDPQRPNAAPPTRITGPTANLLVPLRLDLGGSTRLRASPSLTFGIGRDQLTWDVGQTRVYEETRAFFGSAMLLVGPEIVLPVDGPVVPYFGASLGGALAFTWHSDMQRHDLFDPKVYSLEDLSQPSTLSPYSVQPVFATDLAAGFEAGALWGELGYLLAYVPQGRLRRADARINAMREPYGWNAIRIVFGLRAEFGG